ncbi:MAG: DMT family transporter [Terriglobales bacterium]
MSGARPDMSELFAILASVSLALSGMLVGELSGKVDVLRFARWNMLAALLMTGAMSILLGGWGTVGAAQFELLAASSLFGIIFASTTYFAAIYAAGPRTTALLFSLTAPFALVLGYIVLGESISLRQGSGVAIVMCGILLAIGLKRRPASDAPVAKRATAQWRRYRLGIALGVATALGQAIGSLLARPAMAAGAEPFAAMAIRSGVAAVFYVALSFLPIRSIRRPYVFSWRDFRTGIAASFFGTGLGMSLVMAALARGNVGVVSTLSSMTPVAILPMLWIKSGTAPARSAWIGAALAVIGTALISLD